MRSKQVVVTLVVCIILGVAAAAPVAADDYDRPNSPGKTIHYVVPTLPLSGQMICSVDITMANNNPATPATAFVAVQPASGEIFIEGYGIGSGIQPGCDIFPDGPWAENITLRPLEIRSEAMQVRLHAHPGAACTVGGLAEGSIWISFTGPAVTLQVSSLKCDTLNVLPYLD